MDLPESDRERGRIGFQRWYERQLFSSFGWLVVLLLIGFVIGVVLEYVVLSSTGFTKLATIAALYVVGLMGLSAWRCFWGTLSHAQRSANAATCSECGSYGLFDVPKGVGKMPARCRKCGNEWTIG